MRRCLVSLSGGQDSATVLAMALLEFDEVAAVSFDYGQRHSVELYSAHALAKYYNVPHRVLHIPQVITAPSALTTGLPFSINPTTNLPSSYVPGRNLVFSSILVSHAAGLGYSHVGLGVNAVDWSGYPDCTPEFFAALQMAVNQGVVPPVQFYTPLINLNKVEIVEKGEKLHVPWRYTWTCYDPQRMPEIKMARPCLKCFSCKLRMETFEKMGMKDPLVEFGGLALE